MRYLRGLFFGGLVVTAASILLVSAGHLHREAWAVLIPACLVVAISNQVELVIYLSASHLSFVAAAVMAISLLVGPDVAVWAAAIGMLLEGITYSRPWHALLVNTCVYPTATWVAAGLFSSFGGDWGTQFNHPLPALAMATAFMIVNLVLVSLWFTITGRMNLRAALRAVFDQTIVRAYLVILSVGLLVGFAYLKGGLTWALLVVGFAYLLQNSLSLYFEAVKAARSQTQQLEVVLNATQGAMILTDQDGVVQVANRQMGVLFDLDPEQLIGSPESSVSELERVKELIAETGDQAEQVMELVGGPVRFVHWYRAAVHNQQGELQGHIKVFTDVTPLKQAEANLRHLYDSMVRALTAAIDARDSYTHGHSARVSAYSVEIAKQMGLSHEDLERIRYSGLLHDIGKLGVDDHVLRKHGALTPSERALMMQHPVIGAEVLQKANVMTDLLPGVRWHHEWISGGGYPDGLKGDDIPLDARIIGAADALDAMTSDRPYRPALPLEEALKRINANAGIQFDPIVAAALVAAIDSGNLRLGGQHGRDSTGPIEELEEGLIRPVHGKELAILYQLSREDYSSLSLDAMLQRYLATFHETVGPNTYMIYLADPETADIRLHASIGLQDSDGGHKKDLRVVREALDTGAPVTVGDVRSLPDYRPAAPATKSEAVIPLITQEEALGALVVEAGLPDFFNRDELYLLEALGQRLCASVKLVRYHERLAFATTHDILTGAHNHSYFYDRLTEEVDRAERFGRSVSVLLLDLNGLKAVNETYGHLAGDEALRALSRSIKQSVRPGDVVARYGGDEFAIIMPEANRAEAQRMARRLSKDLEHPFLFNGVTIRMPTAVWGASTFPQDGGRASELVFVADRALQQEKSGGTKRPQLPKSLLGN